MSATSDAAAATAIGAVLRLVSGDFLIFVLIITTLSSRVPCESGIQILEEKDATRGNATHKGSQSRIGYP